MIPTIIHYCWFGKQPLPELAQKCIASWRRFLPDYEIKEWNEENFDVNIIPYTKEAYSAKKYAFVSDYARFWILYNYGGIYLDTDVEILKTPPHELLSRPFMACEQLSSKWKHPYPPVAPGLAIAANKDDEIIYEILNSYKNAHFCLEGNRIDLTTIVTRTSSILLNHGLKESKNIQYCGNFTIYPWDYFCPMNGETGVITKTPNTVAIHHYASSWVSPLDNATLFIRLWHFLKLPNTNLREKIKGLLKR